MRIVPRRDERAGEHLANYNPDSRRYDELLDATGAVRAPWQPFIDVLAADDFRTTARRGIALTRRLIAENGVTYNVYADPKGADRPWTLDPLPLIVSAEEWSAIERGVAQRAQLLNALLADLYGPQRLIAEGLVPPELPFGHPNFLWPCHGVVPRDGIWLHLYAADLGRAPDGRWWLLADRTQAPSGAGYALENRDIVSQVFPECIRDMGVRRVHPFFSALRERMLGYVADTESPLAVVLTPGPYNETYFEQAYLARQLGWPLTEGSDLTVRHDTVYLKTLTGLKRVHAIVRRLDDDYCDPLELRSGSALGVPGLIGAVRAGRVILANALGTGVLESAAWLGFIPGLAERLCGETLRLPSVATWWCGERPALEAALANLDHVVVKPTYPNQRFEPVFGRSLSGSARTAFIERLRARPYAYVAQEQLALSQAPAVRLGGAGGLLARSVSMRVYALATANGYIVMPGGLARVATNTAVDIVSSQRGGGSKDIWVLPDRDAQVAPEPIPASNRAPVRHDDMPSRLVENLYWFGRYSVRCEDKARLLRGTLAVRIDPPVFRTAVKFCRELGLIGIDTDPTAALTDDANDHGVIADVRRLAWCASQVRGRLSASYWRALTELQHELQDRASAAAEPREALDRLLLSLAASTGFSLDDMTQDEGWRLLSLGRRIERLQFMTRLLARHLGTDGATAQAQLEWVLEACDSLRVYRPRYAVPPRLGPVLDLLIRDAEHPRAVAFQVQSIARDLAALTLTSDAVGEQLGQPTPPLPDADLMALEAAAEAARAQRNRLAQDLLRLCEAAEELSDRISMRHFSHTRLDSHSLAT